MARRYLETKGWRILAQNWRCRMGELDLVALDGNCVVFVEVRTRQSARFGTAAESVDWRKQKKVRQVAVAYLSSNRVFCAHRFRFDMISIQMPENGQAPVLEHIENAF
jgi:putative endonuclease